MTQPADQPTLSLPPASTASTPTQAGPLQVTVAYGWDGGRGVCVRDHQPDPH